MTDPGYATSTLVVAALSGGGESFCGEDASVLQGGCNLVSVKRVKRVFDAACWWYMLYFGPSPTPTEVLPAMLVDAG